MRRKLLIGSFSIVVFCTNYLYSQAITAPCLERNKWKYKDYTTKHFFVNQIFSNGFGLYILINTKNEISKNQSDSIKNLISSAFRTALTNWGVALVITKDQQPDTIKKYIDDNTFKEGGRSFYNAPQVFTVDCPENANFVIQVYIRGGQKFHESKSVLAKAQIKGRSVILNMQTQKVVYTQRFFDVMDTQNNYNLVPILAHELGHCFGLLHTDGFSSIMASTAIKLSKIPTAKDGINLASILQTQIVGSTPGYFSPTECVGLTIR